MGESEYQLVCFARAAVEPLVRYRRKLATCEAAQAGVL